MPDITRRTLVAGLAAGALAAPAQAQPTPRFTFDDVIRRARELAGAPFDATPAPLPDALAKLDFDAWRDIRFRPDKAFFGATGGPFRLQAFHLGHLYTRPVTINLIRDGLPTPIPYAANLFDYGRTKFERPLPVNLGFAGFRLHYPLNDPKIFDEAISFLGASYFRFLGRGQRYGMSARALAVNAGADREEFPFFREFWVETPEAGAGRAVIFGLLDSASVTGAFRFDFYPGQDSVVDVGVTLFPRRNDMKLGLAPLTSMFFASQNDRRFHDDFRPELHDSDGLLIRTGSGEMIWRPLRNPAKLELSTFLDANVRGFGLLQRDRVFEDYQDLELAYELRPSYWVEPRDGWGEGRLELAELPTADETNDNVVAAWTPRDAPEPGRAIAYGYRITASLDFDRLSPGGRVRKTYQTQARALGSNEAAPAGSRRFIIDFTGGDLAYFATEPTLVEVVPTSTNGRILRSFITPNPHINGFRAGIDVQLDPGQSSDLRAFLRAGSRTLTETWTFPWKAD